MENINIRLNKLTVWLNNFVKNGPVIESMIQEYVFTYQPEDEIAVRRWIKEECLPNSNILPFNLFHEFWKVVQKYNIKESLFNKEKEEGSDSILEAVEALEIPSELFQVFNTVYNIDKYKLCVMFGVGEIHPLQKANSLLQTFEPSTINKPLLLLYPGSFNKSELKLFNKIPDGNNYRLIKI